MKRSLLAILLLAGSSLPQMVECRPSSSENTCVSCVPTRISAPTTITTPGVYCLTNDIVGSIRIDSGNVVLDLNSHLVDGNGAPFAIYSEGFDNITIKNGAVNNAGSLGIGIVNANGFVLNDVQAFNCSRAFFIAKSKNSEINALNAYDNFNTFGPVVMIDNCDTIELFNVNASHNIKELDRAPTTLDPGNGIIAITGSRNILLTDCTVNNNVRTTDRCRFVPLVAFSSRNVSFINCQANENSTLSTITDTRGFAPIHIRSCSDVLLEGCQANSNTLELSQSFFRAIYVLDTPNNVIKNCQANNNLVNTFIKLTGGNDLTGIFVFATFLAQANTVITDCQVCGNVVENGGTGRTLVTDLGQINGILLRGLSDTAGFANRSVIARCETSDNVMQSSAPYQTASGITIFATNDVIVDECTSNGNRGGIAAYGIYVLGLPSGSAVRPCRRVNISRCTANDSQSTNFATGFFLGGRVITGPVRSYAQDCEIVSCQADHNTATNGFGIVLQNARSCSIVDCETNRNSSAGALAGIAIGDPSQDNTPSNTYCSFINTSAKENGSHGFEIDIGSDYFLLDHNVALANGGAGFADATDPLTNTYLSNYAASNSGPAFFLAGANAIQLYTYTISAGTYGAPTSGTPTLTSLTNIQAIP